MVTVNVNGISLAHKGSGGTTIATLPDVCKTPSPGGPVPIPYPNISRSSALAKGTKKVKADGKMIAIKGSEFSSSNGDEAGTAGGIKSSVNRKEAKWITSSMNVMFEGKAACRLTDKMTCNSANTVCLGGELQLPLVVVEAKLQEIACACDEEVQPGPYDSCMSLGDKKHACCEEKLTREKGIGGERGYNRDGTPFTNGPRAQMPGEHYWAMRRRISGAVFPDACALYTDGSSARFYDFKFGCPAGVPRWVSRETGAKGPLASGNGESGWTPGKKGKPGQFKKYSDLGKKVGTAKGPKVVSNKKC